LTLGSRSTLVLTACLALVASTMGCVEPAAVVARLMASAGTVTVRTGESSTTGVLGLGLIENDVVSTGDDGQASVDFEGGNAITLGPNTSLLIKRSGSSAAQFGIVLLKGEARASSRANSLLFAIGTPFGFTEIGGGESDVSLSATEGIVVHMGVIELTTKDGAKRTIQAGNTLTLDGMIVPIGGAIVLEPMVFILLANPAQVQVKRAGETDWRAPTKRDQVVVGDSVRTRKATGTRLQLGSHAGVVLDPQSELTLHEATSSQKGERAAYALASGNAVVELSRGDDVKEQVHEIEVAGQKVKIEPGALQANVEVSASASGRAQVSVREGKATLENGAVIEAGSVVNLEKGKPASEARPLAQTYVSLRAPGNATVYYSSDVPPVSFSWSGERPGPYEFELAKDKEFKQILVREQLTKNGYIHDRLRAGRYYWRVKLDGEWKASSVSLEKNRDEDCKNCKRTNIIDDTGENTVVYFQKALPAISLRWGATPGAANYRVKVFADGAFDKAIVDQQVAETTVAFPAGTFAENRYFWLVMAMNAQGQDVAPGKMNSLTIAYDNAVADIDIKGPKSGTVVTTANVSTNGEVELGSKLYVNGKIAELDKKGRFKMTIELAKGGNQVVYRTVDGKGVERMYVRDVYRK
jgi:hypothetical protein